MKTETVGYYLGKLHRKRRVKKGAIGGEKKEKVLG